MANLEHRFPLDLGSNDSGHFIKFEAKQYSSALSYPTGLIQGFLDFIGLGAVGNVAMGMDDTDTFYLFVPGGDSPFTWEQKHEYSDVRLAREISNAIAGGLGLGDSAISKDLTNTTMQLGFGRVMNPRIELLYKNTALRNFKFNFMMAPTTPDEANQMIRIINRFRFHAAPRSEKIVFFEVPSEFTITVYYKDANGKLVENLNLPRIAPCMCEYVSVDYPLPGGVYSTFHDGKPVSAMLTLSFVETKVIDKFAIQSGKY